MKTTEANIAIKRDGGVLSSISVIMPMWHKHENDTSLSINLPLLGLKTFAKDEDDADTAIEEAIKSFCIAAEKFGKGIETELQVLGWDFIDEGADTSELIFTVESRNVVLEQIMETGEQYANKELAIA